MLLGVDRERREGMETAGTFPTFKSLNDQ